MIWTVLLYGLGALTIGMMIREALFGDPYMNALRAFAQRQGLQ